MHCNAANKRCKYSIYIALIFQTTGSRKRNKSREKRLFTEGQLTWKYMNVWIMLRFDLHEKEHIAFDVSIDTKKSSLNSLPRSERLNIREKWYNHKKAQGNFSIWTKDANCGVVCLHPQTRLLQVSPKQEINTKSVTTGFDKSCILSLHESVTNL
jgi:hypothetical protein